MAIRWPWRNRSKANFEGGLAGQARRIETLEDRLKAIEEKVIDAPTARVQRLEKAKADHFARMEDFHARLVEIEMSLNRYGELISRIEKIERARTPDRIDAVHTLVHQLSGMIEAAKKETIKVVDGRLVDIGGRIDAVYDAVQGTSKQCGDLFSHSLETLNCLNKINTRLDTLSARLARQNLTLESIGGASKKRKAATRKKTKGAA